MLDDLTGGLVNGGSQLLLGTLGSWNLRDFSADQHQIAGPIQSVPEHEVIKEFVPLSDWIDDPDIRRSYEARDRRRPLWLHQIVALHKRNVFIDNAAQFVACIVQLDD